MKRHFPLLVLTAVVAFSFGQFTQFPVALAATPTTDQLLSQIQALQTKVATIESTTLTTRTSTTTTESRLAALQAKVDTMANVLQVTPSQVLLKTPGAIAIEAGTTFSVLAASTVNVRGMGTTTVSGSFVKLNGGSKPVSYNGGTSATVQVP